MHRQTHQRFALIAPGLAILLVAAVVTAGSPAAAGERAKLTYTLYIGYFSALEVKATVSLGDGRYRIDAMIMPQAWIAWALPWTARSFAEGRLTDGVTRPEHHRVSSSWGSRSRKTEIDFGADGRVTVAFDPPVNDPSREPVPDDLKAGAIDPASAVATLSEAAGGAQGCAPVIPLFDGRRRFDIKGERLADTVMAAAPYTAYTGPAIACRLSFVTVAGGYRDGERSRFWQATTAGPSRPPIDVWLARLRPDQPPLPVYAIGESILGAVTVYLSAFRFESE